MSRKMQKQGAHISHPLVAESHKTAAAVTVRNSASDLVVDCAITGMKKKAEAMTGSDELHQLTQSSCLQPRKWELASQAGFSPQDVCITI